MAGRGRYSFWIHTLSPPPDFELSVSLVLTPIVHPRPTGLRYRPCVSDMCSLVPPVNRHVVRSVHDICRGVPATGCGHCIDSIKIHNSYISGMDKLYEIRPRVVIAT
jgi:hypothetical protein